MRGDGYSDNNTLSAVRYFYDFGFWQSKLRPMFYYNGDGNTEKAAAYTHYPALPDLIAGVEAHILNTTDQRWLRIFPILCAIAIFFLIFKINEILLGNSREAFLGASAVIASSYFLAWGDTLHKHTYEELWKFLTLFLLLAYYGYPKSYFEQNRFFKKEWSKPLALSLLALICYLNAQTSFESALFCTMIITGFSIVFEKSHFKKLFGPLTMICGCAFVLGLFTHMYLNALYYGSWGEAFRDIHQAMLVRTGQCEAGTSCGLSWLDRLRMLSLPFERFDRQFAVPGVVFALMCFFVFRIFKARDPKLFQIAIVLLVASLSWYFAMPQHAFVHGFVGKHPGPLVALVIGGGLLEFWRRQKESPTATSRVFYKLVLGVSLAAFLWNQVYVIYWKYGFSYWFH